MLFDERHLEQERLEFACRDDVFKVANLSDETHRLDVVRPREVGTDPVLQVLRFPDVDDLAVLVLMQVTAGVVREER